MSKPKIKQVELLFTHCWNGHADLPFATTGEAAKEPQGKKVKDLPWLKEELDEGDTYDEWTLDALRVGEWDGDDEVYAYVQLKEPDHED